jgi:hypothetical protein
VGNCDLVLWEVQSNITLNIFPMMIMVFQTRAKVSSASRPRCAKWMHTGSPSASVNLSASRTWRTCVGQTARPTAISATWRWRPASSRKTSRPNIRASARQVGLVYKYM